MRFINPDSGCIALGQQSSTSLSPSVWREQFAWVPQRPYLFHATVAENIRLGRPSSSKDHVIQAAQNAHAHEFIQSLPKGYDTVIEEGGARLSAGQAQRIALARAFIKGAPFLILDEATSYLDPMTETLLQDALQRLMAGRTVLTIAHRLNTVYQADQILVMDDGRVVERGTHASLLRHGGLYRHLVSSAVGFTTPANGSNGDSYQ
jgi:ATP-binding cassette subfamily C protein CydD